MKILNMIHAQCVGGVDQVFRLYTEMLNELGHEVFIVISDNQHDGYENSGAKNIFKLKNQSQIGDLTRLIKLVNNLKPDIVICHSVRCMKWMRVLKFFTSAKLVAVNHGISFSASLHCQFIININDQIAKMVVAAGFDQSRNFVLNNWIKVDRPFHSKEPCLPPIIGIYGRLEHRKGFDILLAAAGILRKKNIDIRLKIGGSKVSSDYSFDYLKKLAQEHEVLEVCDFVGLVKGKENFFEDVDILCVPSREEPFGLVIAEGFLFSRLVISSDTDGGKLLIENGKNGILFKNQDPEDLANKISELILDKSYAASYKQITKEAFIVLKSRFSQDAAKEKLGDIMISLFA